MPREDRLRKWYWTMLETAKAEVRTLACLLPMSLGLIDIYPNHGG